MSEWSRYPSVLPAPAGSTSSSGSSPQSKASRLQSRRSLSYTVLGAIALAVGCAWVGYLMGSAAATRRCAAATAAVAFPSCPPRPCVAGESGSAAAAVAPLASLSPSATSSSPLTPDSRLLLSGCHRRLSSRGELPAYLNALGLTDGGVEIGVKGGEFSEHLLKNWKNTGVLHLVDPWLKQDSSIYNDISNSDQGVQDARYAQVSALAARFPGHAQVHRAFSVDASRHFADESLDFVYVDARHDYAGAMEDLTAWWPKLRVGGLMAGHDFVPDGTHREGDFGVQRAVGEFALRHGKEVQSISDKTPSGGRAEPQHRDGGWTTFYMIK